MPTAPTRACLVPRCPHPAMDRGRCALHRQTTSERSYGPRHQRARRELRVTLPAQCAYGCGTVLTSDGDWVAAHVVDGDESRGWVASCRTCNERAKTNGAQPMAVVGSPVEKSLARRAGGMTRVPNRRACQNDSALVHSSTDVGFS